MKVLGRIVIAAVTIAAVVMLYRGCAASLRASGATVYEFFRAVGAGDASTACRLLSGAALTKFQTRVAASSCPEAVDFVYSGLTPAERVELVNGTADVEEYISAIRLDFSVRTEITFESNPLGMELIVLADVDGRETISDWGWDVKELSST